MNRAQLNRLRGDRNGARTKPHRNTFVRNRDSGLFGERRPMAKLSLSQVRSARVMFAKGKSATEVAKKLEISVAHACRIRSGQSWTGGSHNAKD